MKFLMIHLSHYFQMNQNSLMILTIHYFLKNLMYRLTH
jgi:hypothetical protein